MTARVLIGTDLHYEAAGRTVLEAVTVSATAGRLLAVWGPSGAGKSTLLALLAGVIAPTRGAITLDGVPVTVGDTGFHRRTGVILQGYGLHTALTARENVAIALQAGGTARREVRRRTGAVLAEVGLAPVADHLIEEMSGGQQQRVAVARALVTVPDVVLADEPTAELDAENRERVITLLTDRARSGSIVVVASHDPDVVARCDDVLDLIAVPDLGPDAR